MKDIPETTQSEITAGPDRCAAKALLAGADWKVRFTSKGVIPILSPESSPEAIQQVAAALDTVGIPYKRIAPECHQEFNTPLRIKSAGRPDFVEALKDPVVATIRSAGSKSILRIESAVSIGDVSAARGR